jgi:hypothetical protein
MWWLGSARASRAGFGASPKRTLVEIVVLHRKPLTMDEFTCLG